jgi:iron complex outermembrane receptor protein
MLDLTGGYSYQQSHAEYPELRERGLTSNLLGDNGIPPATNVTNTKYVSDFKLISFFGRANYNISDRYIASVSIRRDGSSRFGPTHQWGTFPAVSLGWRLSEESFLQGFAGLSDLKLTSWAQTGNRPLATTCSPDLYVQHALTKVQFGGSFITTIDPARPILAFIGKTDAYDVGLDYGFNGSASARSTVHEEHQRSVVQRASPRRHEPRQLRDDQHRHEEPRHRSS